MTTPAIQSETLWNDLGDRMRRFIRKRVGTEHDADDVLQDVFVRIHERLGGVRDTSSVVAWMFTIARNAITDHYRAQAIHPHADHISASQAHQSALLKQDADASAELAACMRPFVEQLPENYRRAVTLVDLDGRTHEKAAEQLGLSISGCKSRVQRGRRMVRDMLLDCCHVELDRRKGVVDYARRNRSDCDSCEP
jgi:RNA polymerase sigma-70 factor (ECF subfamily)